MRPFVRSLLAAGIAASGVLLAPSASADICPTLGIKICLPCLPQNLYGTQQVQSVLDKLPPGGEPTLVEEAQALDLAEC